MSVYYLLETLTSPDQAGLETRSCLGVGAGFISVSERFGSVGRTSEGQEFGLDLHAKISVPSSLDANNSGSSLSETLLTFNIIATHRPP